MRGSGVQYQLGGWSDAPCDRTPLRRYMPTTYHSWLLLAPIKSSRHTHGPEARCPACSHSPGVPWGRSKTRAKPEQASNVSAHASTLSRVVNR